MLESSKEGSSCLSRASPCYSGATDRQRMAPSKAEVCSRILEGEKRERTALRLRCERFSQAQLCSSAVVVSISASEIWLFSEALQPLAAYDSAVSEASSSPASYSR